MNHEYDVCDFPEGEQLMFSLGGNEDTTVSGEGVAASPDDKVHEDKHATFDCQSSGGSEEATPVMIEKAVVSASSEDADTTQDDSSYASEMVKAVALIVERTIPELDAGKDDPEQPTVNTVAAEDHAVTNGDTSQEESSQYPKFVPAVRFGPTVDRYEGQLYLSRLLIFNVTAKRQKNGFYAVSGMVSMIDPATGHVMQESGDRLNKILKKRADKGRAPITDKRSYVTAVKTELNVKVQKNQTYTQAIKAAAIEAAQKLSNTHKALATERTLYGVSIEKLDLSIIFDGYGVAYLDDRTTSENSRAKYKRLICGVADVMGDLPLEKWSKGLLTRKEKSYKSINVDSIKETLDFLDYFARKQWKSNPVADCLKEYIEEKGKQRKSSESCQDDATNPVSLPSKIESFLDQKCWENLGDPRCVYVMLEKEGGVAPESACELKIKDILFNPGIIQKVFVNYRRDNIKSATHNYTFPLFPCGAVYINSYLKELEKSYGPDRLRAECYLLSEKPDGSEKYDAKKLKDYINEVLSHHEIGYAALAGLKDITKKTKGSFLLRKTYEDRLNKIFCASGCKTKDDGAVTFMMHRSLVQSVQADHYRAFTDATGSRYLYESLCKDKRDPMKYLDVEKTPFRRKSTQMKGDMKKINFPAAPDNYGRILEITLEGLKSGDEITFEAQSGLLVGQITTP